MKINICILVFFMVAALSFGQIVKDKIFMNDGQILTGTLINDSFQFDTIYGSITVPIGAVRKIERKSDKQEILYTVNDEIISGYIGNEFMELMISSGPKINVRKELIDKIIFSERQGFEHKLKDYFMMINGDIFYGRVLDKSFEFTSSYGNVNTSFSELLKIEDMNGQTKMYLANGNVMTGYIATQYINITTNYGFNMKIPKASIKLIQIRR